jgi:hypothetical protein
MPQALTKSELLFEKLCKAYGIRYELIPAGNAKTPDYNIYLDRKRIAIEIKEIDSNPEEEKKIQEFEKQRTIRIKSQLGKRVRDKITDAAGKFKESSEKGHPSVLVLYNNVKLYKHTEPSDILAGMYGQLYFPVLENLGQPLKIGQIQSGPKKKMTPDTNTSISAVGVLEVCGNEDAEISVYHNYHARVPLDPSLLSDFGFQQYRVNDPDNPTDWVKIEQQSQ